MAVSGELVGMVVSPVDRRVEVADGVQLHVRAWEPPATDGSAFVLLHGIASNAQTWDGVARLLAGSNRRAYAIDFRGHAGSDRPESGYEIAAFVADLEAVAEGLGLERPILVGHSLGANVALEAAARRPDLAGGVALVEGGLVDADAQFATLDECLAGLALAPVAGMPLARLRGWLRGAHPDWPEWRLAATLASFDVDAGGTVAWCLAAPRYEALIRALWNQHVSGAWQGLEIPAAFAVADTGDADWTAAKHAAAANLAEVLPGAAVTWLQAEHDLHSACPREVAELLLAAFG